MCNVTFSLPRTEERRSHWQLQSKQIRQKAQIVVNIKMPVHFIVSDGFLITTLWQANQSPTSFVGNAHPPLPCNNKTAAPPAKQTPGRFPKNSKPLPTKSPPQ